MKRIIACSVLFLLAAVLFVKIVERDRPAAPPPTVTMEVLDESLQGFANNWRTEVARRFPDAVVVLCHGGTFNEGVWLTKAQDYELPTMDVDQLAQHYRDLFPTRPIVLLCCNPGHLRCHVRGVWHFMDSVFCVPDRATGSGTLNDRMTLDGPAPKTQPSDRRRYDETEAPVGSRWQSDPEVHGNIFEAIEN